MDFNDIKYLLPDNVISEFENDTDAFDSMVNATNQLIKHYSGLDYQIAMINEFVDVFLKLSTRSMALDKEQITLIEANYIKAIDTLQRYKFKNVSFSEVINATV